MASYRDRDRTDPFLRDTYSLTLVLYVLLCEYARQRTTVTKQQLLTRLFKSPVSLTGVESSPAGDIAKLQVAIAEVTEISLARLRVNLCALVVEPKTNRPSGRHDPVDPSGFYKAMRDHGRDVSDPDRLALDEQGRVFALFS
jgi:hypothetical protein